MNNFERGTMREDHAKSCVCRRTAERTEIPTQRERTMYVAHVHRSLVPPLTKPVLFASRFRHDDFDNDAVFAVLTLRPTVFDTGRVQFLDFSRASLFTSLENYPAIQ